MKRINYVSGSSPLLLLVFLHSTFAQMPAGTPTFNVNAKWVTDHGSQVYNVKAYGAYGDDTHDDTAAINAVYAQFCNHLRAGSGATGTVFWPIGTYKITSHIAACGDAYTLGAGNSVGTGAIIDWQGPSYDTPFIMYAAGKAELRDLGINTNGVGQYAVQIVADNTVSTTSTTAVSPGLVTVTPASMNNIAAGTLLGINVTYSDAELVYVTAIGGGTFTANFANAHSGTWTIGNGGVTEGVKVSGVKIATSGTTSGIAIGNVVGGPNQTPEVAETTIDNVTVSAAPTVPAGLVQLAGNNVGNVYVYNSRFWYSQYGIDMGQCSFTNVISGVNFETITTADMRFGDCNVTVSGAYSEPGTGDSFILGTTGFGAAWPTLTVLNSEFAGQASNTITIQTLAAMTLIGNRFNPYAGTAKIVANYSVQNNGSAITSIGNLYGNASTWAPIYDTSSNPELPVNSTGATGPITSIGDYGGYANTTRTPLTNYGLAGVLADSAMGSGKVAQSGVMRGGDTSCLLGFRNHAGSGDLTVCKNTSDQILASTPLGGTQLVSTASGVPPIVVNSAAAVPTLTVQNCSNCNVTGSMNVNGGTPITGMSTFSTASITPTAVTTATCSDQTFAVTSLPLNAVLSNIIPPASLGNVSISGYPSSAGNVLLHFCNPSASNVTPPAGVYSFVATQPQRYSHIQGAIAQSSTSIGSPLTLTLPAAPATGDLVVVAFGYYKCGTPAMGTITVTDGNSNSYTVLSTAATSSAQGPGGTGCNSGQTVGTRLQTAYLLSAPSNASGTITLAWTSSAAGVVMWADEFRALGGGVTYDSSAGVAVANSQTASGSSITLPSIAPTNSGELIYSTGWPTPGVSSCEVTGPAAGASLGSWIGAAGGIAVGGGGVSYPAYTDAEYDLSATGATAVNYAAGCSGFTYAAIAIAFN